MAQFKAHSKAEIQMGIRLSQYDYDLLSELTKKSGYSNKSDYLRYLINLEVVRKPKVKASRATK